MFDKIYYFELFSELLESESTIDRSKLVSELRSLLDHSSLEFKKAQEIILNEYSRTHGFGPANSMRGDQFFYNKKGDIIKKIVIVENYQPNRGASIKEKLCLQFKSMGYQILTLGEKTKYSDYWIEFEDECFYENELTLDLSEIHYDIKGSIRREFPGLLESGEHEKINLIVDDYTQKYKKLYCHVYSIFNRYINDISFALIWGGLFYESTIIRKVASTLNISCYATEFSFDRNRVYFDSSGIIGNNHSFSKPFYLEPLSEYENFKIDSWIRNCNHYKNSQPSTNVSLHSVISSRKTNILLIAQCDIDTVITYNNPDFKNTFEAYEFIFSYFCNKPEFNLIVKLHPGDLEVNQSEISNLANRYGIKNVVGLDLDFNTYSLIKASDYGITINSQAGLEMMLAGKNVLCLGESFYNKYGLGISYLEEKNLDDCVKKLLSKDSFNLAEVKKYAYRFLNDFLIPIDDEVALRKRLSNILESENYSNNRLLIVHPSGCTGGSGYYLQELAYNLQQLGWEVQVLCEGTARPTIHGVRWFKLQFQGPKLSPFLAEKIIRFNPTHIMQVGVRTKPMRAAIEALYLSSNSIFIVQAEDDEESVFYKHYPSPKPALIELLDKPEVTEDELKEFLVELNITELIKVIKEPDYYRWVEPLLRVLCYKLAHSFSCIWYPMAERLENKFEKPSFILPPIVNFQEYSELRLDESRKFELLSEISLPKDVYILFINGTIYDFSDEFERFIDGIALAASNTNRKIALIVSGRSRSKEKFQYAKKILEGKAYFRSLKVPDDKSYNEYMLLSDLICAPGHNDVFNKYRLSSRLVKAIAIKKPILTYKIGFAEELVNLEHGFFSDSDEPESWKELILKSLNEDLRVKCADNIYRELKSKLNSQDVALNFDKYYSIN